MAVTDMDEYLAKLASPFRLMTANKNNLSAPVQGRLNSLWNVAPFGGSAPTTAVSLTKDSPVGSIDPDGRGSNPTQNAYLAAAELKWSDGAGAWLMLCDRLSHQGGLSGTATGTITTNLPTAALTRYTDGVGVMAGIEITTIIGTTGTTITCSYTNQAGTSGRTSQPINIGATNFREANRMLLLNLEGGDSGVRSIESSTLLATTGTAGAFGYTLFKPLAFIPVHREMKTDWNGLLGGGGQLPEILDDAHLFWCFWAAGVSASQHSGTLKLIEA